MVAYLSPGLQANADEKLNLNKLILSVTKNAVNNIPLAMQEYALHIGGQTHKVLYRPSLFYCRRLLHLVSHSQGKIVLLLSGPMPSQGQGSGKLRVFGPQLHPWCSGIPIFQVLQLRG